MNFTLPTTTIQKISKNKSKIEEYKKHWQDISPKNNEEIFWRYVFSFLSVHTSWSTNVRGYTLLKANKDSWREHPAELERLIKESGVGLQINRTIGINKFKMQFAIAPDFFKKGQFETWQQARNRIENECFNLGLAKTSFALEMCFPLESEAVCFDTHMIQLYGYSAKEVAKGGSKKNYCLMEKHWNEQCAAHGIPPVIARAIYWDEKQNKDNSKYWTDVL